MLRGYVDVVAPYAIDGWVIDDQSPDGRARVEVALRGRTIGAAWANIVRADLGDAPHGFHVELSDPILLEIEIADLDFSVNGQAWSTNLAADPRPTGMPFRLGAGYPLEGGWAQEIIRLDRTWVGPEPDVTVRPSDGVAVIRIDGGDVIRHVLSATEASVSATVTVMNRVVSDTVEVGAWTGAAQQSIGRVDTAGPQFITGWMRPGGGPDGRRYVVSIDGQTDGFGLANRSRPDVTQTLGLDNPGFLYPIAKRWKDGRRHTVEVLRADDGSPLAGDALQFAVGDHALSAEWRNIGLLVTLQSHSSARGRAEFDVEISGGDAQPLARAIVRLGADQDGGSQGSVLIPEAALSSHTGRALRIRCPALSLDVEVATPSESDAVGALGGNLDLVDGFQADGWCYYTGQTDRPVVLDAWLGDTFLGEATASHNRPDLQPLDLANTYHGFQIKFPPSVLDGAERQLVLRDRLLGADVPGSPRLVRLGRDALRSRPRVTRSILPQITAAAPVNLGKAAHPEAKPDVTVVILTRDGAEVLAQCLESLWWFTPRDRVQVIVVDHGSVDDTAAVVETWSQRLSIRRVPIEGNNSFSFGNNAAIRRFADTPFVMMLNNDVILTSDVVGAMTAALADPSVGLVGCKLLESRDPADVGAAKVHHAGIQLTPSQDGVVRGSEAGVEMRLAEQTRTIEPFSVTGACAMMRTEDYAAVGGLEERFFYGGEDTALGESVRARLGKRVVCLNQVTALHYRGWYRLSARGNAVIDRVWTNDRVLLRLVGHQMKKRYQRAMYTPGLDWSLHKGVVGFVVLEAGDMARTGESFTARELAAALEREHQLQTVFIEPETGWYDVDGVTCLVNTLHEYGIRELRNTRPDLIKIAWLRNNFELWLEHPLEEYDLLLCSSAAFVEELARRDIAANHLPIATDPERFAAGRHDPALSAPVVFNGSHSGVARGLAEDPGALPGDLAIWGHGWQGEAALASMWRGFLPYDRMPDLYASTRVVIDDAQDSARRWGGTNSRVFDAIAGGALPLTNSEASSTADFDGLVPVWRTPEELSEQARFWRDHETLRQERVAELREIVRTRHSWSHRAAAFKAAVESRFGVRRIAIKVGAPDRTVAKAWGDWHLADDLARRLRARGCKVRVQTLDVWRDDEQVDATIVLRGLSRYAPRPEDLNLLWLISHPDAVSLEELREYDAVALSSQTLMDRLGDLDGRAVLARQFSGFTLSPPVLDASQQRILERLTPEDALVVGNTRGARREFILAVHAQTPLKFIGAGWDQYVTADHVLADHVANGALPAFYARAIAVVNDHWPDMTRNGIVSNRIPDVLASGGLVLSDWSEEGAALFGPELFHRSPESAAAMLARLREEPEERSRLIAANAERAASVMSGDAAVDVIFGALEAADRRRFAGWTPTD